MTASPAAPIREVLPLLHSAAVQQPPVASGSPAAKAILAALVLALFVAVAIGLYALVQVMGWSGVRTADVDDAPALEGPAPQPSPERPDVTQGPAAPAVLPEPSLPVGNRPASAVPIDPKFSERDARLSPEQAFLELWAALDSEDAATAAKFVLHRKLSAYDDAQAMLADLQAISVSDLRVEQAKRKGERAVLFVRASSSGFTDADGRALAAPAVVRMVREDQHWKLFSQMWLINSDLTEPQREALAWLDEDLGGSGKAAEARRDLAARGVTADAEALVSATVQHQVDSVDLLLAAGVSPNDRAGEASAWEHVMIGLGADPVYEHIAIAMLAAGADLGYLTPSRMGPLALAVSACQVDLVEALLQAGAKLDAKDAHGHTPLSWAEMSCPAAAPLLKKAGAR
ncbi:MAG: ankyrin repeat domain-containing protein [Vicinamibacteria bacterium]